MKLSGRLGKLTVRDILKILDWHEIITNKAETFEEWKEEVVDIDLKITVEEPMEGRTRITQVVKNEMDKVVDEIVLVTKKEV